MKSLVSLALSALLANASSATTQDTPSEQSILAMGAYVPSDDLPSAEAFYRTLFDRAPMIQLEHFIAFEIAGGWFAIVSRDRYAPGSVPGTGAVPYIQSSDLDVLKSRIQNTDSATPEIIEEPGIHLLKVTDPGGQLVEFFMLTNQ